jgi:nucleotide-binding universal stress UspA family protein
VRRILVATDGTESASDAELEAARLAAETQAELVVLHVWEPLVVPDERGGWHAETLDELRLRAEPPFARALAAAAAAGAHTTLEIVEGAPDREIPLLADRLNVDLVVLGARRQHAFSRVLFGSVSRTVLEHLRHPLLVVKEGSVIHADGRAGQEQVPTG